MAVSQAGVASSHSPLPSKHANSIVITNSTSIDHLKDTTPSAGPDGASQTNNHTLLKTLHPYVRVCPHQTLSFEQFHQIATTPLLQGTHSLDILVQLSPHHRVTLKDKRTHGLVSESESDPDKSAFRISSQIPFLKNASLKPGFFLYNYWQATFHASSPGDYRITSVSAVLQRANVSLCPHIKVWGGWVVDTVLNLLDPLEDENEIYRPHKRKFGSDVTRCMICDTTIQIICLTKHPERTSEARCLIRARRFLGKGLEENDPLWLNQCAQVEKRWAIRWDDGEDPNFCCKRQYLRGIIHPDTAEQN